MSEPSAADLVIVGAGPAGAAAAITACERGLRPILVDKATFPRDKICGDGLTTGALRLLDRMGVDPALIPSWTPVTDIKVSGPLGHTVTFPLPRDRGEFAVVARRSDVDAAIVARARELGTDVREGFEVTGARQDADSVTIVGEDGTELRARWVVAADGMWSPLRKMLGTATPGYLGEWHAFRQYFRDTGPAARDLWVWFEADLLPGYAWSFPLPDGGANVGFGIQRGAKVTTKQMKALWPELLSRPHIAAVLGPDAKADDRHQAWPIPARIDEVTLTAGRVLWAGDAAAATDPMTGEGIGQALLTGMLATEAILRGGSPATIRATYEQSIRRELIPDHKMSLLLVRALRHRKGARAAIRVAGLTPWTRRNFARWLFEDEPRAAAFTPRRWHRRFLRRDGAYR
ncbi:MAG: NAD(P)/FAD-dependent oxidoreductase [Acidimicrobiales bacterium]|nr:NAD(P)/FAD-dependent oxidoreductase [Acidimicrobiales bacterium]